MQNSGLDGRIVFRLKTLTRGVSWLSICVGAGVLTGWLLHVRRLTDLAPGLAAMKINTALCFLLTGISLLITEKHSDEMATKTKALMVSRVLAGVVAAVGGMTLIEYLLHGSIGIDQFLPSDLVTDGHSHPGRMAPHTAICFVFLGFAIVSSDVKPAWGIRPSQLISLVPGVISLVAIMGYVYAVVSFYRIASYTGIALHTAVILFLFSITLFCILRIAPWRH